MEMPANLDSFLVGSQLMQKSGGPRSSSHYDILQVDFGASRTTIREAYIRLKHTYSGQSQALYSLIDDDTARQSLVAIEEAFKVLSDEVSRREYDELLRPERFSAHADLVVADDDVRREDPFATRRVDPAAVAMKERAEYFLAKRDEANMNWGGDAEPSFNRSGAMAKPPREFASVLKVHPKVHAADCRSSIDNLIREAPDSGDGALFRQIREVLEVSEFEVQQRTKISIEYIRSIEANLYERLPAVVYVRGFLKSYLQYLGIDDSKALIAAYSEKMSAAQKIRSAN